MVARSVLLIVTGIDFHLSIPYHRGRIVQVRLLTPGPWKAAMAYNCKITATDGTVIAAVPNRCPLTREDPANAYLMAAAPDLLKAC